MFYNKTIFFITTFLLLSHNLNAHDPSMKINISEPVYYFGFDERSGVEEDTARYLPLLNYLEKKTHLHFSLNFIPNNNPLEKELKLKSSDFTITGFLGYFEARTNEKYKVLVKGVNSNGSALYRSMLVARIDSNITSIKDIKNMRLAFGNIYSTQGHLIPRIILEKYKISLKDLKGYIYTDSHKACADSVIYGNSDICFMQDTLAKELASKNLIKIIYTSKKYPSSLIAVNNKVPDHIANKVKEALLDFKPTGKDKKGLYNWSFTEMPNGFINAKDSDYKELMDISKKIDILNFIKETNKY